MGQTTAGLGPAAPGLTKRQREVLERLELGMPVKKIAKDTGVTPAAVYQTIERLRRQGAVPDTFTPSGQPPRRLAPGVTGASAAALAPGALAPRKSHLADLQRLAREGADQGAYAKAIEAAIASGDVAALAYELGRAEAEGRDDMTAKLAEAALRRLGAVSDSQTQSVDT